MGKAKVKVKRGSARDVVAEARSTLEKATLAAQAARLLAGEAAWRLNEAEREAQKRPRGRIHPALKGLREAADSLQAKREGAERVERAADDLLKAILRRQELQGYRQVIEDLIGAAAELSAAVAREKAWRSSSHPGMTSGDLAPPSQVPLLLPRWTEQLRRHRDEVLGAPGGNGATIDPEAFSRP